MFTLRRMEQSYGCKMPAAIVLLLYLNFSCATKLFKLTKRQSVWQ